MTKNPGNSDTRDISGRSRRIKQSAALTATMLRIQQLMPDSEALNLVSGKRHSKGILAARPAWTEYSTLVPNTWHPRKAGQSHQQGLLGVQAGRQVKHRQ